MEAFQTKSLDQARRLLRDADFGTVASSAPPGHKMEGSTALRIAAWQKPRLMPDWAPEVCRDLCEKVCDVVARCPLQRKLSENRRRGPAHTKDL